MMMEMKVNINNMGYDLETVRRTAGQSRHTASCVKLLK